jgi:hypothetical protein
MVGGIIQQLECGVSMARLWLILDSQYVLNGDYGGILIITWNGFVIGLIPMMTSRFGLTMNDTPYGSGITDFTCLIEVFY